MISDDKFYWEDGEPHDIPQDYADMHGWEEMAANVAKHYHALPDSTRAKTMIYGTSYGHAGAINLYKDQYNLPEAYSANGSYMWWADANAQFDQILLAADYSDAEPWQDFNTITLLDSTSHTYARDPGYIYLMTNPNKDPSVYWNERYVEMRKSFGR